jgi:MscS family membrane protein
LLKQNRRHCRPLARARIPGMVLAIFFVAATAVRLSAQIPTVPAPTPPKAEPAAPTDPLGRETPRGTVMGLLKYMARGDYVTAARYLQKPPGKTFNIPQFAKQIQILQRRYQGDFALLSDDPNGEVDNGLPPGEMRAGSIRVGDSSEDVILVRVNDPTWGKIWLVSQETVASLPVLAAEVEEESPTGLDRIRVAILSGPQVLGMSSGQWIGWLISIPVAWFLAWLLAFLLSVPRRIWRRVRKKSLKTIWETPLGVPLRWMIAIVLHGFFIYQLHPPGLYRLYYLRFLGALFVGCLAWFVSRLTDLGFDRAVYMARTQQRGGESILVLMRRLNHVIISILALVAGFAILGFNITATLTGLGIGGIAIALGAQKTLENLIGGVSLLMDKAVQVGDVCKIGDRTGTVEDIGLRSLKLRTMDQNLLVVPNGLLAQMQFENLKARPKLLIQQSFWLRIETEVEQLRFVLDAVQKMLNAHPAIETGSSRVRVTNFAGAAFEVEIFAYGTTSNWAEFTAIRQDVILKIAEIVKAAGTRFAATTHLNYTARETEIDSEKAEEIVRQVAELRAKDAFKFPGETRSRVE